MTVILTEAAAVQPLLVTVTIYRVVIVGLTVMLVVVAPVLHRYVPPPVPVSVTEDPAHIAPSLGVLPEVSDTVIPATGSGLTVIVVDAVAVQPLALVTVTVYGVVPTGVTVMAIVVAPVLQRYVPPPLAVSVADAPAQIVPSLLVVPDVSATVIPAVGIGLTVIVVLAVAVQPFALVTVTV